MKLLKIFATIIAIAFVLFVAVKWFSPQPKVITTTTPIDTANFHAVDHGTYRPQSVPLIEHPGKPPATLPSNLKPKDIDQVITIVKKPGDTTQVIIDKKGNVYVPKQNGKVESVNITTYLPPILSFDWYPSFGIDGNFEKISPVVSIGFCEIYGKLQLPVFSLDIQGIGLGANYKLFDPISLGIIYHSNWNTSKEIRVFVGYNF